jgi:rSAM/selenodomain-associated transferase 2
MKRMGKLTFFTLSFLWLADIAVMVAIAPIGKHAFFYAILFCCGHILMILLVDRFPPEIGPQKAFAGIISLGVIARFLFLYHPMGNDIFRYVWEGHIQNLGFNPFVYAPDSPVLSDIAKGDLYPLWQRISHPELSAADPPVSLLIFRALAWLNPDPFFFKMVLIGFDIGVMMVLMGMITQLRGSPSRLLYYAANPLILTYFAGEGHLDVFQLFFLCLAIYLIIFKHSHLVGFLMLGLAIVSKYFALIALPFLINAENRWKSLAVVIPLVVYIPFIDAGMGIIYSLGIFVTDFHYNDSLTVLIRFLFGDLHLLVTLFLLMICLAWVYLFVQDPLRGVYLALGCLLLFLPTLHPWYLALLAPFLVFFPSRAWLYLQAAVVFTFPVMVVEYHSGVFQEIHWLKFFEYAPFYGLLIIGLFKDGYIFRDRSYSKPKNISVIIPTLNEAEGLVRCLSSLQHRTALREVIIADGGSTDKTREIAFKFSAQVVESPRGRGLQIKKGIEAASGDVVIIIHADCLIKKGVFKRIYKMLEARPHAVGGAVGMQFDHQDPKTWLVAFLNNARTFLTGISFGDQAQFFRMQALDHIGGFPMMMLMEDVELSLRLKEVGRIVFLRKGISVSERRWQNSHFSRNLITVFHLFTRYLIGRRFRQGGMLNEKYYKIYYDKSYQSQPGNT